MNSLKHNLYPKSMHFCLLMSKNVPCFGSFSQSFSHRFPRNIFQPFLAPVAPNHPRPLYKLIGTEQEIDRHRRQLQHKGREESKWNGIAPHINDITDESEPAVSACTEQPGDQSSIDRSSHNIVRIDRQHHLQISGGRLRQ